MTTKSAKAKVKTAKQPEESRASIRALERDVRIWKQDYLTILREYVRALEEFIDDPLMPGSPLRHTLPTRIRLVLTLCSSAAIPVSERWRFWQLLETTGENFKYW